MYKSFIKQMFYKSGLLSLLHNRRNANVLTTVSFHRVLPPDLIKKYGADIEWTVTVDFFNDCMVFFKCHYNPISFQQLQAHLEHGHPLPKRPLLVTFDDGWADNLEFAMPITHKHGIRPLLFVTTDSIGKRMLSWRETLHSGYMVNKVSDDIVNDLTQLLQQPIVLSSESDVQQLIKTIHAADDVVRQRAASIIERIAQQLPIAMLDNAQLNQLKEYLDLGTHGKVHEPLTQSKAPHVELQAARVDIKHMTGNELPLSMSFPHGRMNEALLKIAFDAGYTIVFNGSACLTTTQKSTHTQIGRLNISQPGLQDKRGRLHAGELAVQLFTAPIKLWPTSQVFSAKSLICTLAALISLRYSTAVEYVPVLLVC